MMNVNDKSIPTDDIMSVCDTHVDKYTDVLISTNSFASIAPDATISTVIISDYLLKKN